MKIKGSNIILECLKEQGVDTVFGYPGGQIIPLYDALYDYRDDIHHYLTSHEQGATHAADGYARSTGKVGVAFATSGPGATNTVTGIATAFMDSIPMVVITGQVPRSLIGRDSFQEVDIYGITLPVTKHNFFVSDIADLAKTVRDAFQIAMSGRQGPVLIDVPKDIFNELYEYEKQPAVEKIPVKDKYTDDDIKEVAKLISNAKRPLIYAGGGVTSANAAMQFRVFAEKAQIPVVSTLMNLGCISAKSPLSLGMVGMHGHKEANLAVHDSDLIITIGARFSDRVTGDTKSFAPNAFIVQIDVDMSEIDKNVIVQKSILGEMPAILEKLTDSIEPMNHDSWLAELEAYKRPENIQKDAFVPQNVLKIVHEEMGDDTIVVTDVGQHQMWVAQEWPFTQPRKLITSGGLGTMGFGLGAAIGSSIGNPGKRVVHITGDGSFRMNLNELATASANNLPIISILMKNNVLGMVRQWQKLFFEKRYSATTLPDVIDYEKLAESFGLNGKKVNTLADLKNAIKNAKASDKATLIICEIDSAEDVFPMVPPGNAMSDQVFNAEDI